VDLGNVLKLIHVLVGFGLVAGLIGRWALQRRASRAQDPATAFEIVEAAPMFEKLVVLGGPALIVAGLASAAAKGYPFLGLTTGWLLLALILSLAFPFVLAPLVYIPASRRISAALADARARGTWTSELAAAFADPRLKVARGYEAAATTAIIALMVLKPF
jgi:hypothetical protein